MYEAVANQQFDVRKPRNGVSDFIRLGFIPDHERARGSLEAMLGAAENVPENTLSGEDALVTELLPSIIERNIQEAGATELLIPLSGGLDSRGLLGASLEVLPSHRIRTVTYGHSSTSDVRVAKAVCQRIGIAHVHVDPTATEWSLAALVEEAARQYATTGTCGNESALRMTLIVDRLMEEGASIMSGFFGGAITGGRLPHGHETTSDREKLIQWFLLRNRGAHDIVDDYDESYIIAICNDLLDSTRIEERFIGAAPYDTLDFGLRQNLRIRGNVPGDKARILTPYADPAWIAAWLRMPLERRVKKNYYRNRLHEAFPLIFHDEAAAGEQKTGGVRTWGAIAKRLLAPGGRIRKRLGGRVEPIATVARLAERGNPRRNESLRAMYADAARSFDGRRVLARWSCREALEKFLKGDLREYNNIHWAVSAEINLQAGNISIAGEVPS